MTQEHPITPQLELIYQWAKEVCPEYGKGVHLIEEHVATKAARWGADQELEACCGWLNFYAADVDARDLRNARRPKPPSLAEEALGLLNEGPVSDLHDHEVAVIHAALKRLQELEAGDLRAAPPPQATEPEGAGTCCS